MPRRTCTLHLLYTQAMAELEELDLSILRSVASGDVTEVPAEHVDSGHTSWLVEHGYIDATRHALALTEKGKDAMSKA